MGGKYATLMRFWLARKRRAARARAGVASRSMASRLLPLLLLLCTACASLERANYSIAEGVRYAGAADAHDPRVGDVYRPYGDGPRPAVLVIHGGSWRRGSRPQMAKFPPPLANAGYVVFNGD